MKPIRIVISVLTIIALLVAYLRLAPKSPVEKAYRLCATCGLSENEVDGLVETFTGAKESRETLMGLYRSTFDDPTKVDCEDCGEAILDAARVP